MADISIHIDGLDDLLARMRQGDAIVTEELNRARAEGGFMIERDAKLNVQQDTRVAMRSIITENDPNPVVFRTLVGVLRGPATQYARVIHDGREPGKPPPPTAPIARWLKRKGADPRLAYVVARAIGKRGTTGTKFLQKALDKNRGPVRARFTEARDRIVRRLGGA